MVALREATHVRIVRVPPGEAPEAIRAQWVGLVLPLAHGSSAFQLDTVGVLSGKKENEQVIGYLVEVKAAVEILATKSKDYSATPRRGPFRVSSRQLGVADQRTFDMKLHAIKPDSHIEGFTGDLPEAAGTVLPMVQDVYRKNGFVQPWICYIAVENDVAVGTCGFKAPPQNGRVELAYFTFPPHEGKGVATRMVEKLLALVHTTDARIVVSAQTLPEENASTRILRKSGFGLMGEIVHPEDDRVWEWRYEHRSKT